MKAKIGYVSFMVQLGLQLRYASTLSTQDSSTMGSSAPRRESTFPNSVDIEEEHVKTLVRQTGQSGPAEAAIGIPNACQCKHGMPQVFALDPLPRSSGKRMNSGLLKLTCPLLVRAVDELEDEGMIQVFNRRLAESESLQENMRESHKIHAISRNQLLANECDKNIIQKKLGDKGAAAFLEAGVAGASANAVQDVKCLHAWLGDYLFRGKEESPLGAMVANELEERGVPISGTPTCKWQCDPSSARASSPPKPRNKQRLKSSKEIARRRRKKQSDE